MIPPVVILAGGLATRLYPVTSKIPKSLIEVAGCPFIDHQLSLLKEKGVKKVIVCVGQFGSMIEDHIGDGSRWGLDVRFSYDGNKLLGTGGAIKKATVFMRDEFIVLYGDSYLDINYETIVNFFNNSGFPALMTVFHNKNMFDKSNILMKNGKIERYEKNVCDPAMEYIDYGLEVICKSVFEKYPADKAFDLSIVLSDLINTGQMAVFEVEERFYEIGSITGIKETGQYIRKRMKRSRSGV